MYQLRGALSTQMSLNSEKQLCNEIGFAESRLTYSHTFLISKYYIHLSVFSVFIISCVFFNEDAVEDGVTSFCLHVLEHEISNLTSSSGQFLLCQVYFGIIFGK